MTTRRSLWASLFISGVVLLPGCISIGTYQAYPGKKLPDKETALIKRGNELHHLQIDGEYIPSEHVILLAGGMSALGDVWER